MGLFATRTRSSSSNVSSPAAESDDAVPGCVGRGDDQQERDGQAVSYRRRRRRGRTGHCWQCRTCPTHFHCMFAHVRSASCMPHGRGCRVSSESYRRLDGFGARVSRYLKKLMIWRGPARRRDSAGPATDRRQPQKQKQALTQMRGAGSDGEQPHVSFGPVHSLSLVHSLWHVHCGSPPGPPQPQR
jgi:hypothetical protein